MYKALIEIGGYNIGDEVPTDKAELWIKMYVNAPVEKVGEEVIPTIVKEVDTEPVNAMYDDYLNRNTDVVKKAISEDNLNKLTLQSLLDIETTNKKRAKVIKTIKLKIKNS